MNTLTVDAAAAALPHLSGGKGRLNNHIGWERYVAHLQLWLAGTVAAAAVAHHIKAVAADSTP